MRIGTLGAAVISLVAHAGLFVLLPADRLPEAAAETRIEVDLIEEPKPPPPPPPPPPEPPPPEPEKAPEPPPPEPPPPPKVIKVAKARVAPPPKSAEPPRPDPEPPRGKPEAQMLDLPAMEGQSVADNQGTLAVPGAGQKGGKGPVSLPARGTPTGSPTGQPAGTGTGPEVTIKDEPHPIDEVKPVYPDDARSRLIEGKVRLRVVVSREGRVVSARVIQGIFPSLDRAAEAAMRKFRFKPARTSDGRHVEYPIVWTMTFQLDR